MADLRKILQSLVNDIEAMQDKSEELIFGQFTVTDYDCTALDGEERAKIEWPNLAVLLAEAKAVLAHEALHAEMAKPVIHEYAFDVDLKAVVRVKAHTEQEARDLMGRFVQNVELDHELAGEDTDASIITITEASITDEMAATLFEVDEEMVR